MHSLDTQRRSIAKAVSYRFLGASVGALIAFALTGKIGLAATFGLLDVIVKIGAYYVHERLWDRISYGRAKAGDYEI